MPLRTAIIVACSQPEAETTRERAALQRRTISAYILHILMRSVSTDEQLLQAHKRLAPWNTGRSASLDRLRTTMLIRCSLEEAARIRAAARHRETTISDFVMQSLRRAWSALESFPVRPLEESFQVGQIIRANLPMGMIITARVKSVIGHGAGVRLDIEDHNQRVERIYPWQVIQVL